MKIIALKLSILFLITGLSFNALSQTINIDSTFMTDTEIFPFGTSGTVYGLSLNGTVDLNTDTSLVRVILFDTLFNEYLVYEAYPLICSSSIFSVNSVCDETCYSNGLVPYSLQIQLVNAELTLTTLQLTETYSSDAGSMQKQAKEALELNKASTIRTAIQEYQMLWFADTNYVSQLSYS